MLTQKIKKSLLVLTNGAKVISNPTSSLEEGKEVKADEATN